MKRHPDMRRLFMVFFIVSTYFNVIAQVQVKRLPDGGYDKRIKDFVDNLKVVDTHEHLRSLDEIRTRKNLDFVYLLHHYSSLDINSSGDPGPDFKKLQTDAFTIDEKWRIIKPYWEASFNTAFNRVVILSIDKLFGINDINESTIKELSDKVKESYKRSDWYEHVLKERCRIETSILDVDEIRPGNNIFRYVVKFDKYVNINSKSNIDNISKQQNLKINTLNDLVTALTFAFNIAKKNEFVAVKSVLAYYRTLRFENVQKEKAEEVFKKIITVDKALPFDDVKPLQDYMFHRILELARANNVPVQLHTGLLAGGGNIDNSHPLLLNNIISEYPDVNFILFHGGYPWGGEVASLAKGFKNVYIDLCWLYIISPSFSERYLHEWIETVPVKKIMGFGGDYYNVENVYGHLLFAKEIVIKVLTEKVSTGYLSEDEAKRIAAMIFHDNAVELYKLKKS